VAEGIVAIAGIGAGMGFQLARNARQNESERIRRPLGQSGCLAKDAPVGDCNRLQELASDYDSFGTLELVSFIVGGAAFIGTATYFFAARPDQSHPVSQAHIGPLRFNARLTRSSSTLQLSADF
jgi:hypothetical protein